MPKSTTRECTLDQLRSELKEVIMGHLSGDEKRLICCETKSLDFGTEFRAQVITQNRIVVATYVPPRSLDLLFSQLSPGTTVSSMLLVDILNVTEGEIKYRLTGHDFYYVHVHGPQENVVVCLFESRQASLKFTNTLHKAIENAKSTRSQAQSNAANRLRELTQLHKDGLITDKEFEQKREEILGEL